MSDSVDVSVKRDSNRIYYLLFFLSGLPALLYQIVWQRALFTLYGVNIESVTIVVTVFMVGLGLGSLAGGWLSNRPRIRLILAFGLIELFLGIFGAFSLLIFQYTGALTAGSPIVNTALTAFALLLIPTMLMGSTLPLLVEHFVRRSGNVGESVGLLYSVNTLGSSAACLAAAFLVMRLLGETGSVRLAAGFNLFIAITALILQARNSTPAVQQAAAPTHLLPQQTIPLWAGAILAFVTGFIALAYLIIWCRLYAFVSGRTAPCFAMLLGFYLLGIAYGSFAIRDACRKSLGNDLPRTLETTGSVVMLGSIFAYLLGPELAVWVVHLEYHVSFVLVFISAALLGAAFPLLSHAVIDPARTPGKHVSILYMSNIAGSALASFLLGFIVYDYWSTRAISVFLLFLGFIAALTLGALARPKAPKTLFFVGEVACVILAMSSDQLFSGLYERLFFKTSYNSAIQFSDVVENRSGVVALHSTTNAWGNPVSVVYSDGVYDGQLNTDIMHDSNGVIRAYAIAGLHPHPKNALVIGLATGALAQILVNNPEVQDVTVVEINPGFLPIIEKSAEVESLLRNPKVHIVIDDGRHWLVANPDRRFDFILLNTSFNWRAHMSNLLSTEFMQLMRAHMNPGGIAYYNTTWSGEAFATGATAFPYALRVLGFLVVSDSPVTLNKDRWRQAMVHYQIDGHPVFDLTDPKQHLRLEEVLHLADELDVPSSSLESRESLLLRYKDVRPITDDNMGTEWDDPANR